MNTYVGLDMLVVVLNLSIMLLVKASAPVALVVSEYAWERSFTMNRIQY